MQANNVFPNELITIPASALSVHPLGAQTQMKMWLQRVCQTYQQVELTLHDHSNYAVASCMLENKQEK